LQRSLPGGQLDAGGQWQWAASVYGVKNCEQALTADEYAVLE